MNPSIEQKGKGLNFTRRGFLQTCSVALAATAVRPLHAAEAAPAAAAPKSAPPLPLKIGIRAATLKMVGDASVIQTAAGMPHIRGVELQGTAGARNLRDWDVVRQYKKDSDRWDIRIPSIAGIWDKGSGMMSPKAGESIQLTVRAAEMLGCNCILLAFFGAGAPDMKNEASYGPVVTTLQKAAPAAAEAGVILGLENSLSPADNAKLVDLVGHPAVRVYYDLHNMETMGHPGLSVPGVKVLGRERICAVHVKNGDKLLEAPGPVDWVAALAALQEIGYDGWITYESGHKNTEACIADTARNNAFLMKHFHMPTKAV